MQQTRRASGTGVILERFMDRVIQRVENYELKSAAAPGSKVERGVGEGKPLLLKKA